MAKDKHPTEKVGRNPKINEKTETAEKPTVVEHAKPETVKSNNLPKSSYFSKVKSIPALAWSRFNGLSKNMKLASILAVVLVVVGLFAFILSSGGTDNNGFANEEKVEVDDSAPRMGIAVTLQQGTLEAKDEEGNWADAPDDFQPVEGDALRTVGAASRAVLTFDDGSALRLDANSEIELISLNVERIVIRHLDGYTYSRVIPADDRAYIVESTDAQYEAQGTAFKTAASGDEQAVEVYQSSVLETSSNEEPKEGEKLTVKNRVEPSKDGNIEKLDIEVVKQDQFMLWNKELDEQDENFKNSLGFLKDFTAPEIKITSHQEGQTVLLDSNANEGTIEFSGNTEKGSSLTVQSKSQAGSSPVTISLGDNGEFTTPVLTAPLGSSVFEFTAKDRTGNKTTFNIRINFQRKSAPVGGSGNVILEAEYDTENDKVIANWALTGSLEAKEGYKLVYSNSQNPTYPSDNPQFIEGTSASLKAIKFDSGKSYYFRVCIYDEDNNKCTNYSNQVKVDIP